MAINVYVVSRVSADAHFSNRRVCRALETRLQVFLPQDHNPWNTAPTQMPREVFQTDLAAMQRADAALVIPPYGRDCAWEIGWFSAMGKPVVLYSPSDIDWLRDWMVKGGISIAATANRSVYDRLRQDDFLRKFQTVLLSEEEHLVDLLLRVCAQHFPRKCA